MAEQLQWPFEPHRIEGGESAFGYNRGTYFHAGIDLNVMGTSGNQDLKTKLYPIYPCEVIYSELGSTGYGNIVIYEIKGPWGVRWVRYAHCDTIIWTFGNRGKGTEIALMGTSGNSTASHLHMDIFKKRPLNWRQYAPTKAVLDEYFENPLEFMEKWKIISDEETFMDKVRKLFSSFRSSNNILKEKGLADGVDLENEKEAQEVVNVLNDFGRLAEDLSNTEKHRDQVEIEKNNLSKELNKVSDLNKALQKVLEAHQESIDRIAAKLQIPLEEAPDGSEQAVTDGDIEDAIKRQQGAINRIAVKLQIEQRKNDQGENLPFTYEDLESELYKFLDVEDQRNKLLELWQQVAGERKDFNLQIDVIKNWIQDYQKQPQYLKLLNEKNQKIEDLTKENQALRAKKPTNVFKIGRWLIWFVKVKE